LIAVWLGFDRQTTVASPKGPLFVFGLLACLIFGFHWANNDRHLELRRTRPTLWFGRGVAGSVAMSALSTFFFALLMGTIAQWIDRTSVEFPATIIKVDDSYRGKAACRRWVHLSDRQRDRVIRVCAVHRFPTRDIGADLPVWSKVRVHSRQTVLGEVVERVETVRD
jgi:hypothetical protein